MPDRPYSIRQRLLMGLLCCMLVILGSVGMIANQVSNHEVEEIFSARLATSARVLEALVARQLEKATLTSPVVITLPPELEHTSTENALEEGHPYESKIAFQVWHDDGVLLARSATSPEMQLGPREEGFHEHHIGRELWQVFVLKSGPVWIFAAEKNDVREELSSEISLSILTPLLVGSLILLVAVHALALRAIAPIEALAEGLAAREPASLLPVTAPDAPSELMPVVHELNGLLARVHNAFAREQRFIDSAAHELRTPLAGLQLHIQNALMAETAAEREASLRDALTASRRASRLAEQLLVYSRVSASAGMEQRQPVMLHEIMLDVRRLMQPILAQRGQRLEASGVAHRPLPADQDKLERMMRNLIDNASQYGEADGTVRLHVHDDDRSVWLDVDNDGPVIPDLEKSRVFIPYYRLPGSVVSGSGLGLAIVQEIVNQHGGEIRVEDLPAGSGVRIRVRFPYETT